jgi:hypothetical protein
VITPPPRIDSLPREPAENVPVCTGFRIAPTDAPL